MPKKTTSYAAILDAAEQVVLKVGAGNMTLDAVSKEAKLSKGGLLYHFSTKENLIQAMVARLIEESNELHESTKEQFASEELSEVKAFITARMRRNNKLDNMATAVLAAAAVNPALVEPLRHHHKQILKTLSDAGISHEAATTILMSLAGLWLHEALNISPLSAAERKRFIEKIFSVASLSATGETTVTRKCKTARSSVKERK